jgi:hypothetical protein
MKLRIIATLAALFLIGGASGYLAGQPAARRPAKEPTTTALPRAPKLGHIFLHWKEKLQLSPAQVSAMQPTLDASDAKMRAIHAETAEKIRALLRENAQALRAQLTPAQSAEFDRMTQEMIFKQQAR